MNLNEEVELLKGVPIFARIEPAKLKLLAFTSERMTFAAGEELFHQGDPGDAYYAVAAGELDATQDGHLLRRCGRGEGVGEIALLRQAARVCDAGADRHDCRPADQHALPPPASRYR